MGSGMMVEEVLAMGVAATVVGQAEADREAA